LTLNPNFDFGLKHLKKQLFFYPWHSLKYKGQKSGEKAMKKVIPILSLQALILEPMVQRKAKGTSNGLTDMKNFDSAFYITNY